MSAITPPEVAGVSAGVVPEADRLEHVKYRLANAALRSWPYEHVLVEDVFPLADYADLLAHFPRAEEFRALSDRFPRRGSIELTDPEAVAALAPGQRAFWQEFLARFATPAFMSFVLERYGPVLATRYRRRVEPMIFLFRDDGTYAIGPHTDDVSKVVTNLFYLPADDAHTEYGTSILVPRDDGFEHDHTLETGWEDYVPAVTVPFKPNTLLSFAVTDRSLHAVRPLPPGAVRQSIQYFIVRRG
jgi:hypothetical protein